MDLINTKLIISCVLSVPGSKAFVERIVIKWSTSRTRCIMELIRDGLQVSASCDWWWKDFSLVVCKHQSLLESVKSSKKDPCKKHFC